MQFGSLFYRCKSLPNVKIPRIRHAPLCWYITFHFRSVNIDTGLYYVQYVNEHNLLKLT